MSAGLPVEVRVHRLRWLVAGLVGVLSGAAVLHARRWLDWWPGALGPIQLSAWAGVWLQLAVAGRPWRELTPALMVGAVVAPLSGLGTQAEWGVGEVLPVAAAVGVAAALTQGGVWVRASAAMRAEVERALWPGVAVGLASLLLPFFLALTVAWHPLTWDAPLEALDLTLGGSAATVGARWLQLHAWAEWLLILAYYVGLPVAVQVAVGLDARRGGHSVGLLERFLVATALGFALYHLLPAAGPRYLAGAGFPSVGPGPGGLEPRVLPVAFRNCVPSMHVAWTLLLALAARGRRVRVAAWGFVAVTVLATVALGEHYVVDLVVAAPFAVAVEAWARGSRRPVVGLAALVVGWMLALRWGMAWLVAAPAVTWSVAVATVTASAWAAWRLEVAP